MARPLTVYAYASCDTCRRGLRHLRDAGIEHTVVPIRETPPSEAELRRALAAVGGDIRRLFNTSGQDYRRLGLKDKLPALSEADALKLLTTNGNLVKRPLVLGTGVALVGYKPEEWRAALGK